jgi:hypothetical protein
MTKYAKLIEAYQVNVACPDVCSLKHLDMLLIRSEIARGISHLTIEQYVQLLEADQMLLSQARRFYQAIQKIGNLAEWRREVNAPVTHWWWHLDVLALERVTLVPSPRIRPRVLPADAAGQPDWPPLQLRPDNQRQRSFGL